MKKTEIHFNINKDDFNTNDYIYLWDYFKERPSKIIIYENFIEDKFLSLLEKYNYTKECSLIEIIPYEKDNLLNKRMFVKVDDNLFISYTTLDSDLSESFANDIFIYHNTKGTDLASKFIDELNNILIEDDSNDEEIKENLYSLSFESSGFEQRPIKIENLDHKNIDLYYNKNIIKKTNKLIKTIKKSNKGFTLIYGQRGVGKTSLVKYISKKLDKNCYFIPCTSFETTIINPEFRNFLSKNTDSIIILDDSDIYFSELYSKSNIFTNIILQLVDGLDSDLFNLHIIALLNVSDENEIDHSLVDCNNLIDIIEVDELTEDKIKDLGKHLGKKINSKTNMKLSQIFKKNHIKDNSSEIGF